MRIEGGRTAAAKQQCNREQGQQGNTLIPRRPDSEAFHGKRSFMRALAYSGLMGRDAAVVLVLLQTATS